MLDDPLSLLAFAVWTLAMGMYPLGFMFGVCSACCECAEECNKCTQAFGLLDGRPCFEDPDSVVLTTEFASKTFVRDGELLVTEGVQHLPLTDTTPCNDTDVRTNTRRYLAIGILGTDAFFGEYFPDGCGCPQCAYTFSIRFQMAERNTFAGKDYDFFYLDDGVFLGPAFVFDKCTQDNYSTEIVITKAQIEEIVNGVGDLSLDCPGSIEFFEQFEELRFTFEFNLDDPCECGACCREGVCAENELQGYCESNEDFWADLGNGEWQGTGTDCDPNPCPQPVLGACCDEQGQCSVTTESECNGIWYEGVTCDPSPCVGACCDQWAPGGCTESLTQEECGGYLWQFNSGCEGLCDPPLGSCCDNGECTETTEDECGGTWTEGQRCDPDPC